MAQATYSTLHLTYINPWFLSKPRSSTNKITRTDVPALVTKYLPLLHPGTSYYLDTQKAGGPGFTTYGPPGCALGEIHLWNEDPAQLLLDYIAIQQLGRELTYYKGAFVVDFTDTAGRNTSHKGTQGNPWSLW